MAFFLEVSETLGCVISQRSHRLNLSFKIEEIYIYDDIYIYIYNPVEHHIMDNVYMLIYINTYIQYSSWKI